MGSSVSIPKALQSIATNNDLDIVALILKQRIRIIKIELHITQQTMI